MPQFAIGSKSTLTEGVRADTAGFMLARTRQLSDDLWRLRIDSECGLVVNVFLLRSGDAICLIDTGFTHTTEQLRDGLSGLGLPLEAVTDVLYTHTHADHIGGGVALGQAWCPHEWLWEGTTPAFGDLYPYLERIRSRPEWPIGFLSTTSKSDPLVAEMQSKPRTVLRTLGSGSLARPSGVPFGESVTIGEYTFECVDGRGHDPFHCGWFCRRNGWLFSGDVLMAVPTPLVIGMGDEVSTWLATLERWESSLEVSWLLPGHGMPTRLFHPSVARSRGSLERLYTELRRQLETDLPVEPLLVTRGVLPADRSRFGARSAVLLANVETLLAVLEARGVVASDGRGRWQRRASIPELTALG
jgi:glyoxylase-like metal-dependent hydrolase (beta-lactamase superfamily II)